jgi:hypothetical protein
MEFALLVGRRYTPVRPFSGFGIARTGRKPIAEL